MSLFIFLENEIVDNMR